MKSELNVADHTLQWVRSKVYASLQAICLAKIPLTSRLEEKGKRTGSAEHAPQLAETQKVVPPSFVVQTGREKTMYSINWFTSSMQSRSQNTEMLRF